ncbi:MAG: thiamine pyrophosphate-dependent enzyme [Anaerolineales bacterium]|nr:thiamine pyrophosphate-dependent enzyme [Anaerolineales bacterium]
MTISVTDQTLVDPSSQSPMEVVRESYKGKIDPDWCPGCGDFSVLAAIEKTLTEMGLQPHQVVTISGIGCSSNLPGFINTYGMHTLHGRALAVATGVKMSNHELTVLVTGGDGDGFGIGGNHFLHTMRRNVDLTYIVMDNQIYGLTTGQTSPTSVLGMQTKSTPEGNLENPINPIPLAMAGGATFVARGYSGKQSHLVEVLKQAIEHRGFSFVDVFSPCVTYNLDNTYKWFRPRIKFLEDEGHDSTDFHAAIDRGYQWGDEIPVGVFWRRDDLSSLNDLEPVLSEGGPLAFRPLGLSPDQSNRLISEMM